MNRFPRRADEGFTFMELVTVIVIAGILSAFAIARINTQGFSTEGFANQAAAMVRYAQKLAISQHRNVFVVISGNAISLCYIDATCVAGTEVPEPPGTAPFKKSAPGATLSGSTFSFDMQGRPSAGGTITVNDGSSTQTITVATETGYVQYAPQ